MYEPVKKNICLFLCELEANLHIGDKVLYHVNSLRVFTFFMVAEIRYLAYNNSETPL